MRLSKAQCIMGCGLSCSISSALQQVDTFQVDINEKGWRGARKAQKMRPWMRAAVVFMQIKHDFYLLVMFSSEECYVCVFVY